MKTAAMLTLTTVPCSSGRSLGIPRIGNRAYVALNPRSLVTVLRGQTKKSQFGEGNRSFRSLPTTTCCFLMDVVARSGVEAGNVPSNGSPGSWKLWILGMVISVVLPFWKSKWGPLLTLKNEVETMVDVVERAAEIVEAVAEKVEEVADEVGDHLPAGRLKEVLEIVEDAAEEIAKDAHRVDAFIEKIEQMEKNIEKEVENIIEFRPAQSKSPNAKPVLTYPEATEPAMDTVAANEPAVKESDDHN